MNQELKDLLLVGVDTHKNEHTLCITSSFGQPLGLFTVESRSPQIRELLADIDEMAKLHNLTPVFGLEDIRGLGQYLPRSLLAGGYHPKRLNPVATERKRSRRSPSG